MQTTSTSLRRGKVKRRKPLAKPQLFKENTSIRGDSSGFTGKPYVPPPLELTWAQRHPAIVATSALFIAIGALIALIYLIPKASPPSYEVEKKSQPTFSERDRSLTRPGQRAAPTDSSFLSTPYRKDVAMASGTPTSRGAGAGQHSSMESSTGQGPYGDGTVTRKGGACQVKATGSGNFAEALADCVNGTARH